MCVCVMVVCYVCVCDIVDIMCVMVDVDGVCVCFKCVF